MGLKERFLKYVSFETTSIDDSMTSPSNFLEKKLGEALVLELKELGLEAFMDEYGYVYSKIKSNCNSDVTIGLIAHMDTSPDAKGKDIKPRSIIYKGGVININDKLSIDPLDFPAFNKKLGHEIIITDGNTLLGADDKAGIAIIMDAVEKILKSGENRPNINICFTPDEEIGRGTEHFNVEYFKEGTNKLYSYTLDGGEIDEINDENFNAASAKITVHGLSIHPGSAKARMVNSQLIAMEFNSMLNSFNRPENTTDHEGFNHLHSINGDVTTTTMTYIIRNHDMDLFNKQKMEFINAQTFLNIKYGDRVELEIKDTYFNMKELLKNDDRILSIPVEALKSVDIEAKFTPIRGGTDGATLSYKGILCPNLGTGGGNFHGEKEYLDVTDALKMSEVIYNLVINNK